MHPTTYISTGCSYSSQPSELLIDLRVCVLWWWHLPTTNTGSTTIRLLGSHTSINITNSMHSRISGTLLGCYDPAARRPPAKRGTPACSGRTFLFHAKVFSIVERNVVALLSYLVVVFLPQL